MKARQKRMILMLLGLVGVGIATFLAINALQSNIAYFFSPSQVMAGEAPTDRAFRLGGVVEEGTLKREPGGLIVAFVVTDTAKSVTVKYEGILPDLFGEGQGVVTKGRLLADGVFMAEEVLAKHDESYMPPEVEDAIRTAQESKAAAKGGN